MFSPGGRRRDSRLPARLSQAATKPALCTLPKCLAFLSGADPLLPLYRAIATLYSMGSDVRVARSSRSTKACPTFSHQPFARGAKSFDHARAHERLSELSVSLR